ncbi:MAG: RpiB/LacA/LacB family sugar-phosphate isomerase [Patescibacteria group bacterium]
MKIYIGADHAGFELKEKLKEHLISKDFDVEDMGAEEYDKGDDYPTILTPLAYKIAEDPENSLGIVIGKSGQGEAMICNRFPGVRAIVYNSNNLEIVRLGREHNDSNVLSLGAGFITEEEAVEAVDLWLDTEFSEEERHRRRNKMLDEVE